jgi:hypothetical protein
MSLRVRRWDNLEGCPLLGWPLPGMIVTESVVGDNRSLLAIRTDFRRRAPTYCRGQIVDGARGHHAQSRSADVEDLLDRRLDWDRWRAVPVQCPQWSESARQSTILLQDNQTAVIGGMALIAQPAACGVTWRPLTMDSGGVAASHWVTHDPGEERDWLREATDHCGRRRLGGAPSPCPIRVSTRPGSARSARWSSSAGGPSVRKVVRSINELFIAIDSV